MNNEGRAGSGVEQINTEQKHVMGRSANACANKFLSGLKGHRVQVSIPGLAVINATLEEFDLYSIILATQNGDDLRRILVFKGPGVVIEAG